MQKILVRKYSQFYAEFFFVYLDQCENDQNLKSKVIHVYHILFCISGIFDRCFILKGEENLENKVAKHNVVSFEANPLKDGNPSSSSPVKCRALSGALSH